MAGCSALNSSFARSVEMRKTFWNFLSTYRSFIIPFLLFVFVGTLLSFVFPKTELFLFVNSHYSSFGDNFFRVITLLGDGISIIVISIVLLFVRYRYSLICFGAYLYSSIIAQVLKHIFNTPRPSMYFKNVFPIRKVDGYNLHEWYSFPSGHSTSVFTLAVVLVYILPKKYGWAVFLCLLPVALSRVYLAQHFFHDVLAGAVLGTMLTFQFIYWFENSRWSDKQLLDKNLTYGFKAL